MVELLEDVLEFLWFGASLGHFLVPGPFVGMVLTPFLQLGGQREGDMALQGFFPGW